MIRYAACLLFLGSVLSGPAHAHHAVSMLYSPEEVIEVSGVVREFRFQNPHCVMFLVATDDQGKEQLWVVEWEGSSALRRRGISAASIVAGDRVTATGSPARDGSIQMALRSLSYADGRPPLGPADRSGKNE